MGKLVFKKTVFMMIAPHCMQVCAASNLQLNIRADVYSEPVSIQSFTDGWHQPLRPHSERAFAQGEITLGAEDHYYRYGLLWRYDYLLSFSPDMARLYHQYANQRTIEPDQQFDLQLDANHLEAYGVYVAKAWQVMPDWQLWTGVSLLKGQHIVEGQFFGLVASKSAVRNIDRIRSIQSQISYVYDEPQLYEDELGWHPASPQGEGIGLNFAIEGAFSPAWSLKADVRDAWGMMYWRDMPRTAYRLQFDDQKNPPHDLLGQLSIDRHYQQRLPWRAHSQLIYQPVDHAWHADLQMTANRTGELWQAGLYRSTGANLVGLHVEPQTGALGLSLKNRNFSVFYLTDHLNTNQAHRISLMIQGSHTW